MMADYCKNVSCNICPNCTAFEVSHDPSVEQR